MTAREKGTRTVGGTGQARTATTRMQDALGQRGLEEQVREALERVDGKPAPDLGPMQVAMSAEARIRLIHRVVRGYLDEQGHTGIRAWAHAQTAPPVPRAGFPADSAPGSTTEEPVTA